MSQSSFDEHIVVLADSDRKHAASVVSFLSSNGLKVVVASDAAHIFKMFEQLNPDAIIADLQLESFDILDFIITTRKRLSSVPIIITSFPEDVDLAVQAVQQGAFDYLLKPYRPEILLKKINHALQSVHLAKQNSMFGELVSLHDITNRLLSTHTLDELLDITFNDCLQILKADEGVLQLLNHDSGKLYTVRKKEASSGSGLVRLETVATKAFSGCCSVLVADYHVAMPANMLFDTDGIYTCVSSPLMFNNEVIGVVALRRIEGRGVFTGTDVKVIDMFASHAGIAIRNADMYRSINQKLDEQMLISNYSEQLMGVVDKYDVIRFLFETAIEHFHLDFIGFLVLQRRTHEFLFWSRGPVDDASMKKILKYVAEEYSGFSNMVINEKRISAKEFKVHMKPVPGETRLPFNFQHLVPVGGDDFRFGAAYFGAARDFHNVNEKKALLSGIAGQTCIALRNSKIYSDMKENYIKTIKALAIAVDAKDTYTHGHSENVMNIAEAIALEMNIDERQVGIIRDAGLLHDIGKIGIPGYILNKPGPLTFEEFNGIMKTHSALGANIVKDVPFLRDLYKLILYHHEHYNGAGYPDGLKGEQIPVGARVLHVADAFEAMTSNRPYRNSLDKKEAIKRLCENSGRQFDPVIIDAFLRVAGRKGWI
ncbi:MAG: HD domain-containing protein [Fibrobacter sp.]|nr:HD domain-containing protein [Fibrobacter sp.]